MGRMRIEHLVDYKCVILTPEPRDNPDDLQDAVHDELVKTKPDPDDPASKPRSTLVVLDFGEVPEPEFPTWMKAAGPAIPDVHLRIVVSPARLRVARALGLTFYHEWYDSLVGALKGGA